MAVHEQSKRSRLRLFGVLFGGMVGIVLLALVGIKVMYGGGALYPDVDTKPPLSQGKAKVLTELPLPPGMVVTSPKGRIFFTYHPFGEPLRFAKGVLFELVGTKRVPFPSISIQKELEGMMGITIDKQERLWLVIPGQMKNRPTRVMAIDLPSKKVVFSHKLPKGVGGLAQDLRVSSDGKTVYLADTGLMRWTSGYIVVLDVASKHSRVLLKGHPSMMAQNWRMRTHRGTHSLGFGLITFAVGLDGIALSPDGKWLYYASMSHDSLYRVETKHLLDQARTRAQLEKDIQFVSKKPLSDGIAFDTKGNLFLTDVEAGRGLSVLQPNGKMRTFFRDERVVWADCVHVANDGTIYMTDSAIPAYLDPLMRPPTKATLQNAGPYRIYVLPALQK